MSQKESLKLGIPHWALQKEIAAENTTLSSQIAGVDNVCEGGRNRRL
jgi:hypothetical protein